MMSMFSPPRREKARGDESHLPKGDCRYILLHPEVKGLRCACVGFALNQSIPGSTCDCGHQACYHVPEKEPSSVEKQELTVLKEKVRLLEEKLDRERYGATAELVDRLGRLEEMSDKSKAESDMEIRDLYRGIRGLWQNVEALQKKTTLYDDRMEHLVDDSQRMRNRLIEVDDDSMLLEDRVEALEKATGPIASLDSRRRKASTPPSVGFESVTEDSIKTEDSVPDASTNSRLPLHILTVDELPHIQSFRRRVASVGSGSQAWTVHISLLPISSQPFPFEKDTAAYKRCLSRGLHRVVAIPDTDFFSFRNAVDEAFSENLRGRPWQPLVARICDAKNLRGLPMLRQLEDWLVGQDYDYEFLQRHCAVTDESGKINDLYIAMSEDTISWAELKEVTPFMGGLEASWIYDPFLDGPCLDGESSDGNNHDTGIPDRRPAAGDILPTWSPSNTRLKRKESEITRASSFGSSTEGESSRAKIRRPCPSASVEIVGRRAEAV
jgi:hypothetical protein